MDKYKDAVCPVCGKPFTDSDDIVVCPDCGAPHHRACWQSLGHCGCTSLHGTGQLWRAPSAAPESPDPDADTNEPAPPSPDSSGPDPSGAPNAQKRICPACRAENNPDASFCSACGCPLNPGGAQPFAVAIDPLGGVSPDEEIDGIPAKELGTLVGPNSAYYIPRFREISQNGRKFMPNLAAFLFDIPWFFYRKMLLPGLGMLILELALSAPSVWMSVQRMLNSTATFSSTMTTLANGCASALWLVRIIISCFANKIYLNACTAKARQLHQSTSEPDLPEALRRKGGVIPAVLWIWVALTVVLYMAQLALIF